MWVWFLFLELVLELGGRKGLLGGGRWAVKGVRVKMGVMVTVWVWVCIHFKMSTRRHGRRRIDKGHLILR